MEPAAWFMLGVGVLIILTGVFTPRKSVEEAGKMWEYDYSGLIQWIFSLIMRHAPWYVAKGVYILIGVGIILLVYFIEIYE